MSIKVLIVFYSRYGSTRALADEIAFGIDSVTDCEAVLRQVPPVTDALGQSAPAVPDTGCPYVTLQDLKDCDGLMLGSPTRFGNMSAPLKYFLDSTSADWLAGTLTGKPAGVFTSTSSMHGGQESTLLTMAIPLIHHGMVLVGVPYSVPELSATRSGGTPYGSSHLAAEQRAISLSADEVAICRAHGSRVANIARKLQSG
ncbi:MAG: NAD(P)H:quinone oxidoreductase [Pseudomonadota bacterium]